LPPKKINFYKKKCKVNEVDRVVSSFW